MDWIEHWFGMAPDNGDGVLELSIMLIVAAIVAVAVVRRRASLGTDPRHDHASHDLASGPLSGLQPPVTAAEKT
jgi:hypothetical protein